MKISVNRSKPGAGLTLRARKGRDSNSADYEQTIQPGESAFGFTFEEWDAALGSQSEGRFEITEDGALHPLLDDDVRGPRLVD